MGIAGTGVPVDAPEIRVEELARRADVSVDTIRFYQKRQLLPPPRREGRIAWYGADHVERLHRIKELQRQGFSLAVIRRLVDGELDAADAPLAAAVAGAQAGDAELLTLDDLAGRGRRARAAARRGRPRRSDRPATPRRRDGLHRGRRRRAAAGLRLLEAGFPLPELLDLARRHHDATRAIAADAVEMFDEHVRRPIQHSDLPDDEKAERLVDAFRTLLPTVDHLVANHFRSVLLEVAQEHLEAVGDPSELAAARSEPGWENVPSEHAGARSDGALPEGDDQARAVEGMFDRLAPRYDRMNRIISLGLDRRWRHHTVADLGASRRRRACSTSRAAPATCAATSRRRRLPRRSGSTSPRACSPLRTPARLSCAPTARRCPSRPGSLDGITCGFALRNFVDLDTVFAECARALRSGGRFAALDATVPTNPVMRAGNTVWFRGAVPLLGRVLAHDAEAYRYLPKSTAYLPPTPELADRLGRAGLPTRVHHTSLTGGSVAAAHRDPHMTTTPTPARLRAVTREVEPGRRSARAVRSPTGSRGCTTRPASSPPASRPASRPTTSTATPRRDRARRPARASPAPDPSRSARCRSTPTPHGELVVPGPHRRRARRAGVGHRDRPDRHADSTRRSPLPDALLRRRAPFARRVAVAVEQALAAIERGDLEKVVLAREVLVEADTPFDGRDIVRGLVAHQPGSFVYVQRRLRRRQPRAAGPPHRRRRRVTPGRRHHRRRQRRSARSRWRRR